MLAHGDTRRPHGHEEPGHDQHLFECPIRDEQYQGTDECQRGDGQPRHARDPPPQHAIPGGCAGDEHAAQENQAARELAHREDDRESDGGDGRDQGEHSCEPPPHRISPT